MTGEGPSTRGKIMRTGTRHGVGAQSVAFIAALWISFNAAAQAPRGLPDFTDLYERSAASVVSIETKQKVRRAGGVAVPPGIDENDPFYDFFRRFGPRGQQRD